LSIHEDKNKGVYVKGLSDYYVGSSTEVYEIMRQGSATRVTASTSASPNPLVVLSLTMNADMNAESSRSHSIFVITIIQRNTETGTQKTGSMYLVDLAGSEKIGKTGATGQTLEEAKKINKSLSALGMVINSLTDGKVRPISPSIGKLLTGRAVDAYPISRFETHSHPTRIPRRKLSHDTHHQLFPLSFFRTRDALDSEVWNARQVDQELCEGQC
jgi:hypothetical protein